MGKSVRVRYEWLQLSCSFVRWIMSDPTGNHRAAKACVLCLCRRRRPVVSALTLPLQKDKRSNCACLLRTTPSHNQVSSRHMPSCVPITKEIHFRCRAHFFCFFSGSRSRRHRRRHSCRAMHEPTRLAQGQIPSIDARARARHRARHMVRPARNTRQRGLARAVSRAEPECHGQREQLGPLLSLVRPRCSYLLPRRSLNAASVTINSSAARPKTRPTGP